MSEAYRSTLKYAFSKSGVYYWEIGGVILTRALPFLDDPEFIDYYEDIHNSNNKAATAVANKLGAGRYSGIEYNDRIYPVAEFLKFVRDPITGRIGYGNCHSMIPLVTGRPIGAATSGNAGK